MHFVAENRSQLAANDISRLMELMNIDDAVTINMAVDDKTLTFHQLLHETTGRPVRYTKGELVYNLALYIQVICNNAWTLPQPLTAYQAAIIVQDLLRDRPEYSIEDVVCILRLARMGYFGPVYNRIDPATFAEWVQKYVDYRCDKIEEKLAAEKELAGSPARDSRVAGLENKMVRGFGTTPGERYFEGEKGGGQ